MASSSLRIIVTGLIAQHPSMGGVTWDYLQYVVGLKRLGHDVYYFEDSGEWPYNVTGGATRGDWIAYDGAENIKHLSDVMARFGLAEHWAYYFPIRHRWIGLSDEKRREVVRSADLLLNVSGSLRRPRDYRQVGRLAYIDSDPAFSQVKLNLPRGQKRFKRRVAAHDVHFSFGERVHQTAPGTAYQWRPTRQPIVLDEWRPTSGRRNAFTTVMNWTSYRPIKFENRSYGQKDVEFRRFLDLPTRVTDSKLEVALSKTEHQNWQAKRNVPVRDMLTKAGWRVVDAASVCYDLDAYRAYIESSSAEWSVAKNGYVVGQPGWFSCRSACYLASGRPVVVQDTGFGAVLPLGEGILPFSDIEEAAIAIRDVEAKYERHARAARAIAEEYFDSGRVLSRLIEDALSATRSSESRHG
jgi:hypothetical protein